VGTSKLTSEARALLPRVMGGSAGRFVPREGARDGIDPSPVTRALRESGPDGIDVAPASPTTTLFATTGGGGGSGGGGDHQSSSQAHIKTILANHEAKAKARAFIASIGAPARNYAPPL
jgi:hypothetical protein